MSITNGVSTVVRTGTHSRPCSEAGNKSSSPTFTVFSTYCNPLQLSYSTSQNYNQSDNRNNQVQASNPSGIKSSFSTVVLNYFKHQVYDIIRHIPSLTSTQTYQLFLEWPLRLVLSTWTVLQHFIQSASSLCSTGPNHPTLLFLITFGNTCYIINK